VSPVRYELEFYIPEDDILHGYRRENLESYEDRHNYSGENGTIISRIFLVSQEPKGTGII
jgi:hypothetical protein